MRFILANLAFVLGWEVALRNVQCVLVRGIERVAQVYLEHISLPAESVLDVRVRTLLLVQQVSSMMVCYFSLSKREV